MPGCCRSLRWPTGSAVLVHASRSARHTQGLTAGAHAGILVHEQDAQDKDPLQMERLMFDCTVQPFERKSPEWEAGREAVPHTVPRQPHHIHSRRLHALSTAVRGGHVRRGVWSRDGHRTAGHPATRRVGLNRVGGCAGAVKARAPCCLMRSLHVQCVGVPRPGGVPKTVRGMDAAPGAPTDGFTAFFGTPPGRGTPTHHAPCHHEMDNATAFYAAQLPLTRLRDDSVHPPMACSARARDSRASDASRSCRACCRGAAGAGCLRRHSA